MASRERLATFIESEKKRPKLKKAMNAVLKGMRGGGADRSSRGDAAAAAVPAEGTPAGSKRRGAAPPAAHAASDEEGFSPSLDGRSQCAGGCTVQ